MPDRGLNSMQEAILSFNDYLSRFVGPVAKAESAITLRAFYESNVLPEIEEQAAGSLAEDRYALAHWERHTGNPELRAIDKGHLIRLRDGMLRADRRPGTINKTWRELRAILQMAADEELLNRVPQIGRRMKSRLVREPAKAQREIITREELTRLWHACEFASYPNPKRFPTAAIWRTILLMFWLYGPRTQDLFRLRWDSIYASSMLIRFEAMKTKKLQGLPLTPLVFESIRALRGLDPIYVFPLRTKGHFSLRNNCWIPGYYTAWRAHIQPAAGIGEPVLFKNFRETMVTNLNAVEPSLGNWIAGHYMPGVSAQNYDLPTQRIRRAIESVEIPNCFRLADSVAG